MRFKRAAGHKDLFYIDEKDVEFKDVSSFGTKICTPVLLSTAYIYHIAIGLSFVLFCLWKIVDAALPKAPLDTAVTAHWLAVEGVQPTIPENPSPEGTFESEVFLNESYFQFILKEWFNYNLSL